MSLCDCQGFARDSLAIRDVIANDYQWTRSHGILVG